MSPLTGADRERLASWVGGGGTALDRSIYVPRTRGRPSSPGVGFCEFCERARPPLSDCGTAVVLQRSGRGHRVRGTGPIRNEGLGSDRGWLPDAREDSWRRALS